MDQYDALRKMVFDGGRLMQVEEFRFESPTGFAGFVMAFTLAFEKLKAHVIAMPDDDTVGITLESRPHDPDSVVVAATDASVDSYARLRLHRRVAAHE